MLEAVIAIGDAEFCGGNAELAVLGGDADVRHHRDLYAAAEAESPDAGNGRLRIVRQQGALRVAAFGILFRGLRLVAAVLHTSSIRGPCTALPRLSAQQHPRPHLRFTAPLT